MLVAGGVVHGGARGSVVMVVVWLCEVSLVVGWQCSVVGGGSGGWL